MLDGKRYFAEFPDEQPQQGVHARLDQKGVHARLDCNSVTPDDRASIRASLRKLALLEQELARFLRNAIATDRTG